MVVQSSVAMGSINGRVATHKPGSVEIVISGGQVRVGGLSVTVTCFWTVHTAPVAASITLKHTGYVPVPGKVQLGFWPVSSGLVGLSQRMSHS